ncbi:MAG: ABC transporter permease subunit, partial [Marivivens sp.]|nr:ABC transporter permease subunit [Marivivens sp.]
PILILVFTLWLGLLPGGGWNGGQWNYVVMPVIALSTSYMASIARITRSSMLEVMNSGFIRTARAKGLPMSRIVLRHALKPALLPTLSYLGPAFVGMVTGSVVVDIYFSTGGIGQYFVNSAFNRDYSVIMGITILVGVLTIFFNLVVDILYAWIDPKIRY